ncbi:MAG: hypothetical protein AAGB34_00275, partial [Planctomycetota bacterium]
MSRFHSIGLILVIALIPALSGCAWVKKIREPRARATAFTLISQITDTEYVPESALTVYAYRDANTADIISSSWTVEELREYAETGRLRPGSMLHIHYFLTPAAGQTPIDFTANNVTIS